MHGSILPVTIPPQAYPWEFAILFSLGGLFPTPGHAERDNSHPRDSSSTTNTLFCVQNRDYDIDFRSKAKLDVMTRISNAFL